MKRSIHPVRAALTTLCATASFACASLASAGNVSLVGNLDATDPNDVLLVSFTFAGGAFTAQSYGFGGSASAPGGTDAAGTTIAPGGFDTYFSLFAGSGAAATFLVSNDDGPCPPAEATIACRDSRLDLASLAAGTYTLAVSVFDNFSFAENLGTGTLGDGFIGLGSYFNEDRSGFTTSAYAIDLAGDALVATIVPRDVPEPAGLLLLSPLVAWWSSRRRRTGERRRSPGTSATPSLPSIAVARSGTVW